jgi:hypothetical protein
MDAGRDLFWEELSAEQRDAVTLLGWNPRSWDEGDPEPMESKFWAGVHQPSDGSWRLLTTEERQAAEMLGHTRETWDHGLSADEAAACIQSAIRAALSRRHGQTEAQRSQQAAGAMHRVSSRKQYSRVGLVLKAAGRFKTATVVRLPGAAAAAAGKVASVSPSRAVVATEGQAARWQRRQGITYDSGVLELWRRM